MSWDPRSIGDFTHVVTKGTTPTKAQGFSESGVNYIKAEALNGDSSLDLTGGFFITDEVHQQLKRSILECGDVLLTIAGANIGKCGIVEEHHLPANTNQAVGIVRVDEKLAIPRFLYYWFKQRRTFAYIQGLNAQAAQPNINLTMLKNIEVPLPSLSIQRRITSILSAYDEFIENNRRRTQLLEQAARLLYKEWFVHLRFPGHENVTITDGVPQKWERRPFSQLASFLNGFAFKPIHLGDVGFPIVKIPELRDGPTTKTPRNTGEHIPEKYVIDTGDILFSWSGTLLVNIWNHGKGLLNQHLFKVTPVLESSRGFVYFALNEALAEFQNQTTGSTMKHIRKGTLEKVKPLVPTDVLLHEFETNVSPILEQISVLQRQTTEATRARDLFLPRLMTGEVAV